LLRDTLKHTVEAAVAALVSEGRIPAAVAEVPVEISDTKSPEHGDYACNLAMSAAKRAGMNPRQLGELLQGALLAQTGDLIKDVEVAGPGFLNLKLNSDAIAAWVPKILATENFGSVENANPQRINVEFVSVNPNGPITIGSGRGAAFGSALCNVLVAAGNVIHREYYINDGVNSEQMRQFAVSVQALAAGLPVPEKGYHGEYVGDVAKQVASQEDLSVERSVDWWQSKSQELMLARQRGDLAAFGVEFDTWFSEQSLHDQNIVASRIERLIATGVADEEPIRTKLKLGRGGVIEETIVEPQTAETPEDEDDEPNSEIQSPKSEIQNTLWLRSTKFGDDMDRVLRRRDGRLTYIASDVSYHENKLSRPENATKMITILGPDHHGYIGRLTAVVAALLRGPEDTPEANARALAEAKEKLEVIIYQLVRFLKDGKPAPMRKRDGNIYELRDLIDELGKNLVPDGTKEEQQTTGRDVARFFYLMRSHDTTMDFDIDLATQQSDENPVFYAQYAHARICSVIRKAAEGESKIENRKSEIDSTLLTHPREGALIKKILDLPWEVERVAKDYGVHRLTTYAVELARTYHHFYDACRVIQPDQPELSQARLALCQATKKALKSTFDLLGVSAPERLERRIAAE
jgi:arginyl-tRNA synthetase